MIPSIRKENQNGVTISLFNQDQIEKFFPICLFKKQIVLNDRSRRPSKVKNPVFIEKQTVLNGREAATCPIPGCRQA